VNHNTFLNHFDHFHYLSFNKEGNILWKIMWVSSIWFIWKHINKLVFNQAKVDAEEILTLAQVQSWTWMKDKVKSINFSYFDWIQCHIL